MSGIGGFRGVSASQDARFVNKQKRMLKTKKFPKELDVVFDYTRVNWTVIREWTAKRVTELLGLEDEVLIQFIHNRLEELNVIPLLPTQTLIPQMIFLLQDLNPKELYLELMPFLEKNTGLFMKELWSLLASAAASETGIPQQILDAKSEEIHQQLKQQSIIAESIEQQRKKIQEAIDAKKQEDPSQSKPDSDKKEKGKRWLPTPQMREQVEETRTQLRNRDRRQSGFDDNRGQGRRRRLRRESPLPKRTEKDRRRSRSRTPKQKPISKSRRQRRDHERKSPSWDRDRRSPSPCYRQRQHRPFRARNRRFRVEDERKAKMPPSLYSFSRSPPESRHGSPPPPSYNLKLARKREPHDRKSRSVERRAHSGSPSTRSPSPRSRNRMSSTPEMREGTPSPSTLPSLRDNHSTSSPIPKPSTPKRSTPPTRHPHDRDTEERKRDNRREEKGKRQFGGMYAFPNDDTGMFGRHQSLSRQGLSPHRHPRARDSHLRYFDDDRREHRHDNRRSSLYDLVDNRNPRTSRRPDLRFSRSPPPRSKHPQRRRDRLYSLSPSPRRTDFLSDNDSIGKVFTKRQRSVSHDSKPGRRHNKTSVSSSGKHRFGSKTRGSIEEERLVQLRSDEDIASSNSVDSADQAKRKEKLKKKLDEILEKKDSLHLDSD